MVGEKRLLTTISHHEILERLGEARLTVSVSPIESVGQARLTVSVSPIESVGQARLPDLPGRLRWTT